MPWFNFDSLARNMPLLGAIYATMEPGLFATFQYRESGMSRIGEGWLSQRSFKLRGIGGAAEPLARSGNGAEWRNPGKPVNRATFGRVSMEIFW